MKRKLIDICNKCKQIKPDHREFIGLGWVICECNTSAKSQLKEKASQLKEDSKPFVFDETK